MHYNSSICLTPLKMSRLSVRHLSSYSVNEEELEPPVITDFGRKTGLLQFRNRLLIDSTPTIYTRGLGWPKCKYMRIYGCVWIQA